MSERISAKPEPAIFARASQAEEDLKRAMSRMDESETQIEKLSRERDQLGQSIAEIERQLSEIRDEVSADVFEDMKEGRSNKETRELAISQRLRGSEKLNLPPNQKFLNLERQLNELKVKHRNLTTDLELANSAAKAALKRVDGMMSLVRLLSSQLSALGQLFAYDTLMAGKN